jgi:oligoribonuclease
VDELLVWIDCEMTGLDVANDRLLEVACLVTDSELTVLDEGIDIVLSAPEESLAGMVPVVQEMHRSSGLTDAVRASGVSIEQAQAQVLEFVRAHVPTPGRAPLCGNSIATDRGFLAAWMPELDAYLHYRMVDVSSLKELARRWYPRIYASAPDKAGGHRALADIHESIRELAYYRATMFVEPPGPTVPEAKAKADALAPPAESVD